MTCKKHDFLHGIQKSIAVENRFDHPSDRLL